MSSTLGMTAPQPPAPSPLATSQTASPSNTTHQTQQPAQDSSTFQWPAYTSFPPFYTLQPNTTTQTRQLELWSSLITTYCAHPSHRTFRFALSSPPPDLFNNRALARSLKPADIRTLLTHMSTTAGGNVVEFVPAPGRGEQSNAVYVWWRSAAEWADAIYEWVEATGQKGAVLTVFELREEGEGGAAGREWVGMDEGMLRKVLGLLIKRGKAQIFGEAGGGEGVKFF